MFNGHFVVNVDILFIIIEKKTGSSENVIRKISK